MTDIQREALILALRYWDDAASAKEGFVRVNSSDGDPICGYDDWDEAMGEFNYDLADRGEVLAKAVRALLAG